MATILLTGAAGFIGYHTAEALLERGDAVIGVDNLNEYYDVSLKEARLSRLLSRKGFTFVKADVADLSAMQGIFEEHDLDKICHLAAQAGVRYSLENPFAYERSNGMGTLTIFELARLYAVQTVVYASSSSVYGGSSETVWSEDLDVNTPVSVYAATKRYNEILASTYHHLYGLRTTGLRFFTVYGPWGRPDMALFKFVKGIIDETPIDVYNMGDHKRDFTFISDIVAGVVASLDAALACDVLNLGRGEPVDLLKFIEVTENVVGKRAEKNLLPMQPGDVHSTWSNTEKAQRLIGYEPKVSVEEGISAFVEWYREFYDA